MADEFGLNKAVDDGAVLGQPPDKTIAEELAEEPDEGFKPTGTRDLTQAVINAVPSIRDITMAANPSGSGWIVTIVMTAPPSADRDATAAVAVGRVLVGTQRVRARDHAGGLCTCGHRSDQHDRIASRHCRDTLDGGLRRCCVCFPAPVPRPWAVG